MGATSVDSYFTSCYYPRSGDAHPLFCEVVSNLVAVTAIALEPVNAAEDNVLAAVDAVISNVSIILGVLVLLVVRLIISGFVAVGGFARR